MSRNDGLLALAFAAGFSILASSILRESHQSHRLNSQTLSPRQDRPEDDCTTDLAKDLYGLGVRLGVYFQMFSGWIANTFILEEMAGALAANAIFLFALLISIVDSTKTDTMSQMDSLVMLELSIGIVWTVSSLWGYRTLVYRKQGLDGIKNFGGFGTHLRLLLAAAVGWYALWFWVIGVRGLPAGLGAFGKERPERCPLNDVQIFGFPIPGAAIRIPALFISGAWLVYSLLVTLASPLAAITRLMKIFILTRERRFATSTRLRYATGSDERTLRIMSWTFSVFDFFLIIFMMTLIELTLNENKARQILGGNKQNGQILTPSQLLPMLIGAFSFVRVLFFAWELWRSPDGDINPSLGRSDSRRNAKAKRESITGLNILRIFTPALEELDVESGREGSPDSRERKHRDPYFELHKRLKTWQRIMVTWLPWLSLLYFFPWTKDHGDLLPQDEAEIGLKPRGESPSTDLPHRIPTVRFDDQLDAESIALGSRRQSHTSLQDAQTPAETV